MIPTVGTTVKYKDTSGAVVDAEIQAVEQDAEKAANGQDYFVLVVASEQILAGVAKNVHPAADPQNPETNTWWFA